MITLQVERWSDVWHEMEPLWGHHWREVAMHQEDVKLNVNIAAYCALDERGELHLVTARTESMRIVGYHLSIVRAHLHYQDTVHAYVDVYYLSPEYRKGAAGYRLLRYAEETLSRRGVKKIISATKLHLDVSQLYQRMGWEATEITYTKVLKRG